MGLSTPLVLLLDVAKKVISRPRVLGVRFGDLDLVDFEMITDGVYCHHTWFSYSREL